MDSTKEQRAIEYLRSQLNMNDPETVLVVYAQIIDQEVFHTQVGFEFLQELKDYLYDSPGIDNARVPDYLPKASLRNYPERGPAGVAAQQPTSAENTGDEAPEDRPPQSRAASGAGEVSKPNRQPKSGGAPQRKQGRTASKKEKKNSDSDVPEGKGGYKMLFRYSLFMNIVLIAMVIAMFILTLTSDSPNVVNYRTKLEDEYASWEQQLTEREQDLRKREQEVSEAEMSLRGELYMDEVYE